MSCWTRQMTPPAHENRTPHKAPNVYWTFLLRPHARPVRHWQAGKRQTNRGEGIGSGGFNVDAGWRFDQGVHFNRRIGRLPILCGASHMWRRTVRNRYSACSLSVRKGEQVEGQRAGGRAIFKEKVRYLDRAIRRFDHRWLHLGLEPGAFRMRSFSNGCFGETLNRRSNRREIRWCGTWIGSSSAGC